MDLVFVKLMDLIRLRRGIDVEKERNGGRGRESARASQPVRRRRRGEKKVEIENQLNWVLIINKQNSQIEREP